IRAEKLAENVTRVGDYCMAGLRRIAAEQGTLSNVRGRGSLIAFTLGDTESRDRLKKELYTRKVMVLASGTVSIRLRLPFTMTTGEVDELLTRIEAALPACVSS